MKILIYTPLAVLGHHFETDLEIAENHLKKGDTVFVLTCNGQLKDLRFMSCRGWLRCQLCISRQKQGLDLLTKNGNFFRKSLEPLTPANHKYEYSNVSELKNIMYDHVDIGSAYVSSLISDIRDPSPDLSKYRQQIDNGLNLLKPLSEQFEKIIEETKPDLVYFFNGRFSIYRPLLRICQKKKIEFCVHERGSNNSLYSLTVNNMPHDIETKIKEMTTAWETPAIEQNQKIAISNKWFMDRSRGIMNSWRSFTAHQKAALPAFWDESKRNITIFLSSEDEFSSVPGWELSLFNSQFEGVQFLLEQSLEDSEIFYYIRLHPNLHGLKAKYIHDILSLEKYKNCRVIPADSDISSYLLLKSSEKILTFGSTMGIEATYWGVPSVLLGKSFYQSLDVAYTPNTREELMLLINDKMLISRPKKNTYIYGYWISSVGYKFKYYQPTSLTTGKFKSTHIGGKKAVQLLSYFFLFIYDIKKIASGEYSFWHLKEKVRQKINVFLKFS